MCVDIMIIISGCLKYLKGSSLNFTAALKGGNHCYSCFTDEKLRLRENK
jgi:hypothetical protein